MSRASKPKQRQTKLATVHAEFERIAKRHGGKLRAPDVLEAARPARSVLHSYFEWRDGIAAEKYRLDQASNLIRITIAVMDVNGEQRHYRAYVSLSSDRLAKQGYRSMTAVMSNPVWRAQLLEDALAELQAFRIRYKSLVELAGVFEAVDKVATK
jgi:hypothetical protein